MYNINNHKSDDELAPTIIESDDPGESLQLSEKINQKNENDDAQSLDEIDLDEIELLD